MKSLGAIIILASLAAFILGVINWKQAAEPALAGVAAYADWPDDDIIEL